MVSYRLVGLICAAFISVAVSGCGKDRPGMPAEALEACKSASEGAACKMDMKGNSVDGTCRKGPDSKLACMPAGGPPGGSGTPPAK